MSQKRIVIGVDPGSVSGAVAILDTLGKLEPFVADIPVVDRMVSPTELAALLVEKAAAHDCEAIVERVNAMPKQGVSSSFNFGQGYGMILGILGAYVIPVTFVAPSKWKRAMGLDNDGEKSRALAQNLYPSLSESLSRKKDHGRAEALLLAHYHISQTRGN